MPSTSDHCPVVQRGQLWCGECVRQLKQILPQTQVVMLTAYEDTDNIFNSLAAGASGLLASAYVDRFGRRNLLLLMYGLFGLAMLAFMLRHIPAHYLQMTRRALDMLTLMMKA